MIVNQFVLTRDRGKEEGEKLRLTKIYIDGLSVRKIEEGVI